MKSILYLCLFLMSAIAIAHEGHEHVKALSEITAAPSITWTKWIGSFHFIFLHFPIALINMLAVSEALRAWYKQPMFAFSSRFLLISAAILSLPTAILGLIYSYSAPYSGLMDTLLDWHMGFGMATAILVIVLALIRERYRTLYYVFVVLLLVMVNVTGFFGGAMTFGPNNMYPPIT